MASEGVIDIFEAAGLKKPDISILSDEFLAEVSGLPQKNLAVEMLRKLLSNEIKTRSKRNVVQSRLFSEMLEATIRKYQNRAIETAQVIEELIAVAKQMREDAARGAELGLSDDEVAFYDALEVNDSAVKVLGDETLQDHRSRIGGDGAPKHDHRLDRPRECARTPSGAGEAHSSEVRLSAGQAGEGDADRAGTGGSTICQLGDNMSDVPSGTLFASG